MNKLSLLHIISKRSWTFLCCGHRYLCWQLWPNVSFKSLTLRQLQTLTKDVLEPFQNMLTPIPYHFLIRSDSVPKTSLNWSISPHKVWYYSRLSTFPSANIRLIDPIANSVIVDRVTFEKSFYLRVEAYLIFSSKLSNTTTWEAISHFWVKTTNIIHWKILCASDLLIWSGYNLIHPNTTWNISNPFLSALTCSGFALIYA